MHLFPYEKIEKGTSIILYGCGMMGKSFVEQIELTAYCEITEILDRSVNRGCEFVYKKHSLRHPEDVNISMIRHDYIVIAIDDVEISQKVRNEFLSKGEKVENIVCASKRWIEVKRENPINVSGTNLSIAVENRGGVGDVILDIMFLKELRRVLPSDAVLDYYAKPYHFLDEMPFVNHVYELEDKKTPGFYDVYLDMRRIPLVLNMREERVKETVPILYEMCQQFCELLKEGFADSIQCGLYKNYAKLMGKKRVNEINAVAPFGFDENSPKYMYILEPALDYLKRVGLDKEPYITINRAVDSSETSRHPKLWPIKNYNQLIGMIKEEFKEICVVQIGSGNSVYLENVDKNLCGQTSLEEVKAILKYSALHIDIEGGLVHLRNTLYGKSVVIFGPTDESYYGYEMNRNLCSRNCCFDGCEGVTEKWAKGCLLGFDESPCMRNVTPEAVFADVREMLTLRKTKLRYVGCEEAESVEELEQRYLANCKIAVWGRGRLPYGIECSKNNFFAIDRTGGEPRFEYACRYNMPMMDEEFDIVWTNDNQNDPYAEYLKMELARGVRKGGHLIISEEQSQYVRWNIYQKIE